MNAVQQIDATWKIDPATLQRLWPVIDVYGRIGRALASQPNVRLDSGLRGNGSAA